MSTDNGVGAKVFATDLKENDVDDPEFHITYMGKKVLKRLLREVQQSTLHWNMLKVFICLFSAIDT